jgi:tRNA dimethylallyltransferase
MNLNCRLRASGSEGSDSQASCYDVEPVIVIGPTACGKTAFAHQLAEVALSRGRRVRLVNLDAFQFYRGFDLGTAKPSVLERNRYRYVFVDHLDPESSIDAQVFAEDARAEMQRSAREGCAVVAVGGSGLYLRSLLHGLDPLPGRNDALRAFIRETACVQGKDTVYRWLMALDPVRAAELHRNDLVRVERALEIALETGEKPSERRSRTARPREQQRLMRAHIVCLRPDSHVLRARIEQRTADLFSAGWIEEVAHLLRRFGERFSALPAARAIGYCAIASALVESGLTPGAPDDWSLSAADRQWLIERVTTLTWQYARRQLVWNAQALIDTVLMTADEQASFVANYASNLPG